MGKGIRGNSHAVWFHTAPPTRHGQNHHQSAIISHTSLFSKHKKGTDPTQKCRIEKVNQLYGRVQNDYIEGGGCSNILTKQKAQ